MLVKWNDEDPLSYFGYVGGRLFFEMPRTGGSLLDYKDRHWYQCGSPKKAKEKASRLAEEHFLGLAELATDVLLEKAKLIEKAIQEEIREIPSDSWVCCGMTMLSNEKCTVCGDRDE